jgi:small-conductance mechanosensitive channel
MKKIFCLLFILAAAVSAPGYSQEQLAPGAPGAGHRVSAHPEPEEIIAVLPFYDFTGSSVKYLSLYIPELVRDRIDGDGRIRILDSKTIDDAMKERNIDSGMLYDRETASAFVKGLGATLGLGGRYIVQGKSIRIDYFLVNIKKGAVEPGTQFQGNIDDDLLDTVERFADRSTEWFRIQALADVSYRLGAGNCTKLRALLKMVKESKAGIVFSNKWLFSLCIFLSFFIIAFLVRLFVEKILQRLADRTSATIDNDLIEVSKKPLKWIIIAFGFKLAIVPLKLSTTAALFWNNVTTAVVISFAAYFLLKASEILIHVWGVKVAGKIETRINDDLVPLFVKMTKIFIIIITALIVLSKFGIEIGPLVASLGVVGFAIGFAVKDTLSNIIAGIILILDQSMAVGDKVTIDGDTGVIKNVGLRNTMLLTYDNEMIVIPNGDLMNKKFKNFVLPDPTIRVVVNFGVAYGTEVDKVEDAVMNVIKTIEGVVDEPKPVVVFYEMGDFSLNFQAKFWISMYGDQYDKKIEATKKIYRALNEAGISIPFPTHTVYLEK